MDPPQLPWQAFDSQQTLNLSTAAAAAASTFYNMQDYMNGTSFNSFQQALSSNYPSLHSTESTSTTPASQSSVSPGSIGTIGAIGALGGNAKQAKPKMQRKRKKKDPNEPQKPVSAYALFFRDTRAAIKGQNPNATFGQVSKIVASMWDQLDAERKEVYKKKTEAAKKEYLKALAAYRASLVQSPQTSSSPTSQPARSPITTNSASSLASSLGHNFNANLMNAGINSGLSFSQANGNLAATLPNLAMASGQNLANLANFSSQMPQWQEAGSRLAGFPQNWPPAAHTNANVAHSMYLGSAQMHALSSQLGMVQPPWDAHRGR